MAAWCLYVLAVFPAFVSGYTPGYEYMKKDCGKAVSFAQSLLLGYDRHTNRFPANMTCRVQFVTQRVDRRVQLRFRFLNTKRSPLCQTASLSIIDDGQPITPHGGVCGTTSPALLFRSRDSRVEVVLTTGDVSSWGDFQIILTSYYLPPHKGYCNGTDFLCGNGICISSQLTCNGYNDCGDDSDEVGGCRLTAGVIAAIVVCIIVFIAVCSACVVLCVTVRRRRAAVYHVAEVSQPYTPIVNPSPPTGYIPSYGTRVSATPYPWQQK